MRERVIFANSLLAQPSLVWFAWVGFYGISSLVRYLVQNPVYTYTLNIYDLWTHFLDNIFKWA